MAATRAVEQRALAYLRDNLRFDLGAAEQAGLRRFHELAAEISVVPELKPLRFLTDRRRRKSYFFGSSVKRMDLSEFEQRIEAAAA